MHARDTYTHTYALYYYALCSYNQKGKFSGIGPVTVICLPDCVVLTEYHKDQTREAREVFIFQNIKSTEQTSARFLALTNFQKKREKIKYSFSNIADKSWVSVVVHMELFERVLLSVL